MLFNINTALVIHFVENCLLKEITVAVILYKYSQQVCAYFDQATKLFAKTAFKHYPGLGDEK